MSWLQTGSTHYHVELELQDKGREFIWLVVYYICSVVRIYEGVQSTYECTFSVKLLMEIDG